MEIICNLSGWALCNRAGTQVSWLLSDSPWNHWKESMGILCFHYKPISIYNTFQKLVSQQILGWYGQSVGFICVISSFHTVQKPFDRCSFQCLLPIACTYPVFEGPNLVTVPQGNSPLAKGRHDSGTSWEPPTPIEVNHLISPVQDLGLLTRKTSCVFQSTVL